jgi:hypothetical protein
LPRFSQQIAMLSERQTMMENRLLPAVPPHWHKAWPCQGVQPWELGKISGHSSKDCCASDPWFFGSAARSSPCRSSGSRSREAGCGCRIVPGRRHYPRRCWSNLAP